MIKPVAVQLTPRRPCRGPLRTRALRIEAFGQVDERSVTGLVVFGSLDGESFTATLNVPDIRAIAAESGSFGLLFRSTDMGPLGAHKPRDVSRREDIEGSMRLRYGT